MIKGLVSDFQIGLPQVKVLFLGFCFLFLFSESVIAVCCLFSLPVSLLCSQRKPAGAGGWDELRNEMLEKKVL